MVNLDVLVVYSASVAQSSRATGLDVFHPFSLDSKQANYNLSYAYFLGDCKKNGMSAGFTTSADIVGPGLCSTYWTEKYGKWSKVHSSAYSSQVFDKISPSSPLRTTERELLFSDKTVEPFNDAALFTTFFDKLHTYKQLPHYAIPTVSVRSDKVTDIRSAIQKLTILRKKHPFGLDFSHKMVLKDRFGAGGNYVFKISVNFSQKIQTIMRQNKNISFVLQPFLVFDKGYTYKNNATSTDIRLIFQHNLLLQSYVRMAKQKDFRCNEHQGGQLEYVSKKDIPDSVLEIAQKIVERINKPRSLYALDFVISNTGRVYFIEGNIGPGIDWDISKKINEQMSKKLIRSIVGELVYRKSIALTPIHLKNQNDFLNQQK